MVNKNFDWMLVVDVDFPKLSEVTQRMVSGPRIMSLLMRGSVRNVNGKLFTSKQLEERRERALRPLSEM